MAMSAFISVKDQLEQVVWQGKINQRDSISPLHRLQGWHRECRPALPIHVTLKTVTSPTAKLKSITLLHRKILLVPTLRQWLILPNRIDRISRLSIRFVRHWIRSARITATLSFKLTILRCTMWKASWLTWSHRTVSWPQQSCLAYWADLELRWQRQMAWCSPTKSNRSSKSLTSYSERALREFNEHSFMVEHRS